MKLRMLLVFFLCKEIKLVDAPAQSVLNRKKAREREEEIRHDRVRDQLLALLKLLGWKKEKKNVQCKSRSTILLRLLLLLLLLLLQFHLT